MKKLQILVTQYKETEEVVKPLLDSIGKQKGVERDCFSVIIVNDGSNVHLSDEFLNSYDFDIQYVLNPENGGISKTRNTAFDLSDAEYVIYCDADDCFYADNAFANIIRLMDDNQFDYLISDFYEEIYDKESGEMRYEKHRTEPIVFVHGKVYRSKFLRDNEIRWNDELRIGSEDAYYNSLVIMISKKTGYCKTPFYLYKWNGDSIVRSCKVDYVITYFDRIVKSGTLCTEEFLRRGLIQPALFKFSKLMCKSFCMLNSEHWYRLADKKYRKLVSQMVKDCYCKHKNLLENCDEKTLRETFKTEAQLMGGIYTDQLYENFKLWLKRL